MYRMSSRAGFLDRLGVKIGLLEFNLDIIEIDRAWFVFAFGLDDAVTPRIPLLECPYCGAMAQASQPSSRGYRRERIEHVEGYRISTSTQTWESRPKVV